MINCKITEVEFEDGLKKEVNENIKLNLDDYVMLDECVHYCIDNNAIREDVVEYLSNKFNSKVVDYSF